MLTLYIGLLFFRSSFGKKTLLRTVLSCELFENDLESNLNPVIICYNNSRHTFSRVVFNGPRAHDLFDYGIISFLTSSTAQKTM